MATDVIKKLNNLIQLDFDAVQAYEQAIERIDAPEVAQALESFRRDHERHIAELSEAVRQLGGTPESLERDVKGFFIEGFTALRSVTGTEGALKAMKSNEKLTNKNYEQALEAELPAQARQIVSRNLEDERRHLEYIERALDSRIWERAGAPIQP